MSQGSPERDHEVDRQPMEEEEEVDWIELLRYAFVDERVAPDILYYKEDIISAVSDLVQQQTDRVSRMETNADLELERIIYERDLQRTQWLMKAYHRTRVKKIEQHTQYYLHHQEYTQRLSTAELDYAKKYFFSIGRHATQIVLSRLPQPYRSFVKSSVMTDKEDMIPEPDMKHNIMLQPAGESVQIQPRPEDPSHMIAYHGDTIVIQYDLVKDLLLSEEIRLI